MARLLKEPTAYVPLVMSLLALSLVIGYVARFGVARQEDEGTAAHLFQLLMVAQIPVIAMFAASWLPRQPRAAVMIMALQFAAAAAALLPILILDW